MYEEEDDEFIGMFHCCPNCGREYDEIDFEYQRCHFCKWDAEQNTPKSL